jgi:hypothetical protein
MTTVNQSFLGISNLAGQLAKATVSDLVASELNSEDLQLSSDLDLNANAHLTTKQLSVPTVTTTISAEVSVVAGSTDMAGNITVGPLGVGENITLTFQKSYVRAPIVLLTTTSTNNAQFLVTNVTTTALVTSASAINYVVIG